MSLQYSHQMLKYVFNVVCEFGWNINLSTPNVNYSGCTAPLTSKVAFYTFIQQIYVLNILNMVYILGFFSSKCSLFHNSNVFGSCIIHILYTGCAKIKKNNSDAERLKRYSIYANARNGKLIKATVCAVLLYNLVQHAPSSVNNSHHSM